MTTPGPSSREVAIAGHLGDAVIARDALASPDPAVRQLALGALQRSGTLTAADIAAALTDPYSGVRRRAVTLAARHPHVDLLPLLDDPDPAVVEVAAWAAGEHERVSDTVLHRLCALVTDATDPLVREAAVAALGAIGDPRGLTAILAACGDKPAIRRRAVLALAPFDGPEVEAALEAARNDRDWQVRQAAEDVTPQA